MRALARLALVALLAGAVAACTGPAAPPPGATLPARAVELTDTPFHPQTRYQCGPAALATVLEASGASADPQRLAGQVWLPERRGSLQVELIAAARRHERLPYRIDADLEALLAELRRGRPVLVLQNQGLAWLPRWHYAVVVGIRPAEGTVVLRSGTERRRLESLDRFLASWRRAEHWAVVVLPPGELPAEPDRRRYLEAVADLEATGHTAAAAAGFASWLEQEPNDPVALFGRGATAHAGGDHIAAVGAYRTLLRQRPDDPRVLNNLGLALAALGCKARARQRLDAALRHSGTPAVEAAVRESLSSLSQPPDAREPDAREPDACSRLDPGAQAPAGSEPETVRSP